MSLDGFSQLSVSFSSEVGVVKHFYMFPSLFGEGVRRTGELFLPTFCVKAKSRSGLWAEAHSYLNVNNSQIKVYK